MSALFQDEEILNVSPVASVPMLSELVTAKGKSSTVPLLRPFHEGEDPLVGEGDQSLVLLIPFLPELGYGFTGSKDVPQMADLLASEEAAHAP
jgi:hypothetical protein